MDRTELIQRHDFEPQKTPDSDARMAQTRANADAEAPLPSVSASNTDELRRSLGMPRQWTPAGGLEYAASNPETWVSGLNQQS